MVFVKSHIPSRRLNDSKIPSNIQIIPFEINLRKEKWLVASIYKAPSQENKYFLWYLTNLFEKFEPKKLIYRNFKQSDSEQFKLYICNSMSAVRTHAAFENNFVSILDKHAPEKTKILQGNQKSHFNKNLWKQIMIRSRLKNKASKSKNPIDIAKFKQQRNLVTNLNKQAKLQYFEKPSVDCNSKPFWKACKPYFSNKNSNIQENMMLLEKDKLLSKQKDVASTFNKLFGSITDSLNSYVGPKIL